MNAGDREPAADAVLADAESAVTGRRRADTGQAGHASTGRMPPVPESPAGPDFSARVIEDDGRPAASANNYDSFAEAYTAETEANLIIGAQLYGSTCASCGKTTGTSRSVTRRSRVGQKMSNQLRQRGTGVSNDLAHHLEAGPGPASSIETGQRPWCPVQAKIAKSRIRLRVILRRPDLGCESLPGLAVRRRPLRPPGARLRGGARLSTVAKFDATAAACALPGWESRTPAAPARGRPGASRRTSRNEPAGGGAAGAGAARRAGPGHAQRGRRVQPPISLAGKTSGGAAGVPGLPGRIPAAAKAAFRKFCA